MVEEKLKNAVMGRGAAPGDQARRSVPPGELPVPSASVLIVDDEPDVIQALKLRLETAGYHAVTACDGAEALRMLQSSNVDLILADLMMPNLDGLELIRRIRQDPRWFPVQILLFSCHDDPVARSLALEFGALDYLSKTLGAPAIVSRVNEVLSAARTAAGGTARTDAGYEVAERRVMAQLRAMSDSSSGPDRSLAARGGGVLDPKLEGSENLARNADALNKLARALGQRGKAGPSQRPNSGR
jgi:DNA-binding response OmpR family regulator